MRSDRIAICMNLGRRNQDEKLRRYSHQQTARRLTKPAIISVDILESVIFRRQQMTLIDFCKVDVCYFRWKQNAHGIFQFLSRIQNARWSQGRHLACCQPLADWNAQKRDLCETILPTRYWQATRETFATDSTCVLRRSMRFADSLTLFVRCSAPQTESMRNLNPLSHVSWILRKNWWRRRYIPSSAASCAKVKNPSPIRSGGRRGSASRHLTMALAPSWKAKNWVRPIFLVVRVTAWKKGMEFVRGKWGMKSLAVKMLACEL